METKEKETELVQLVRQLRDYVILAGAYNLGFFLLSLPNILFFFIFKLLCVCKEEKQCDSAPPALVRDPGYPHQRFLAPNKSSTPFKRY